MPLYFTLLVQQYAGAHFYLLLAQQWLFIMVVVFFIFHFIGTTVDVYFYIFPFISYWYNNGCLFPNMMTVFIAVDK